MTFSQKLITLRQQNNISQKELAQQLGTSTATVAEWESAEASPTINDIIKLSKLFSVSADILINDESDIENNGISTTSPVSCASTTKKKFLSKRRTIWLLIPFFLIIMVVVTISCFLFFGETKPKMDQQGNPIFIEFTDEAYTNAKNYKGYFVTVKAQVFQTIGDNGEYKAVQVWLDPKNCEQNIIIYYTSDIKLNEGDYIYCTGYISKIHKYTNHYGTDISAPLIISDDLRLSSYSEVMLESNDSIMIWQTRQLTGDDGFYYITIEKIEYSDNETRLYININNRGNSTIYIDTDSSLIKQRDRQYFPTPIFDVDYPEIPYGIHSWTCNSGIITFPTIRKEQFDLTIKVSFDSETLSYTDVTFTINP